jgi:hypothetical protein
MPFSQGYFRNEAGMRGMLNLYANGAYLPIWRETNARRHGGIDDQCKFLKRKDLLTTISSNQKVFTTTYCLEAPRDGLEPTTLRLTAEIEIGDRNRNSFCSYSGVPPQIGW